MKFIDIPEEERKALLDNMQTVVGLKSAIIENDWWVSSRRGFTEAKGD